jgi:hypothetical protein
MKFWFFYDKFREGKALESFRNPCSGSVPLPNCMAVPGLALSVLHHTIHSTKELVEMVNYLHCLQVLLAI